MTSGSTETTFTHDELGRMTRRASEAASTTYTYSALGQLEHVSAPSLEATYSYGIEGTREKKVVTKAGVTTTTEDFYSGQQLTARKVTAGTSTTLLRFVYGPAGTPLELITETGGVKTSYAYQLDWGGSVVGLTTATGATIATYAYDPWGRELSRTGSLADVNPLRYRGYVADDETGLYYLPARYYDPVIARFTSVDPAPPKAGNPQSLNGYVYCEGDPVALADSDGREPHGFNMADGYGIDTPGRDGYNYGHDARHSTVRSAIDLADKINKAKKRRAATTVTTVHPPRAFSPGSSGGTTLWNGFWSSQDDTEYGRWNWQLRPSAASGGELGFQIFACVQVLGMPTTIGLGVYHAARWWRGRATLGDMAIDGIGLAFDPADWVRVSPHALGLVGVNLVDFTLSEGFGEGHLSLFAEPKGSQ